jgi:integral membrane sensor domain MASE1
MSKSNRSCRYDIWPAIPLGAFLVNLTTAGSVTTSIGIAAGNTLEGLLGAYLVRKFAHGADSLRSTSDIFKFTILAGGFSTTVSATLGVTVLTLGGLAPWTNYGPIWLCGRHQSRPVHKESVRWIRQAT